MPNTLQTGERWKEISFPGKIRFSKRYAITNLGRFIAFKEHPRDGKVLNGKLTQGYPAKSVVINNVNRTFYYHKWVAEHFVKRPSSKHDYVIHLNHIKTDNKASNLKWVTREEMLAHLGKNPKVLSILRKTWKRNRLNPVGSKLNESSVKKIRIELKKQNGKTNLHAIGKAFNISAEHVRRIKNNLVWKKVKV